MSMVGEEALRVWDEVGWFGNAIQRKGAIKLKQRKPHMLRVRFIERSSQRHFLLLQCALAWPTGITDPPLKSDFPCEGMDKEDLSQDCGKASSGIFRNDMLSSGKWLHSKPPPPHFAKLCFPIAGFSSLRFLVLSSLQI